MEFSTEHLRILKEGVEIFNEWRKESSGIRPKLGGANLIEANLHKANLGGAYLNGANLIGADLGSANLREANLVEADLRGANLNSANLNGAHLNGANLSGANLSGANLRVADLRDADVNGADLSRADLSGSDITGANTYNWKISGIRCSYIIWNDKRINYEKPDDFEKAFTKTENLIEILLYLPLSDLTFYTGLFIKEAINQKYMEGSLFLKGIYALSNDETRVIFSSFASPDQLGEIQNDLSKLRNKLKPIIEKAKSDKEPKNLIGVKSEVDIPFTGGAFVVRAHELERMFQERHAKMSPLLQSIIHAIQLYLQ